MVGLPAAACAEALALGAWIGTALAVKGSRKEAATAAALPARVGAQVLDRRGETADALGRSAINDGFI
jgi:mannose/fructose/N-acetylgalactosamine-specific phosphotransferase system component IIC